MGYNKEIFKRVRGEYAEKALRAEEAADRRRMELETEIPELRELDKKLSELGLRLLKIAMENGDVKKEVEALKKEQESIHAQKDKLLASHGYKKDYAEAKYECLLCKDTGYVGIKMCRCMREKLLAAEMEASGLSGLMQSQDFENFSLKYYQGSPEEAKTMETVFKSVKNYAENFVLSKEKSSQSLLFLGGTGLGKTHLSTSVAKTVIHKGYDVFYNSAVGMISDFEFRRFGAGMAQTDGDDTARYTECDLLIIDDLGTEVVNQFTLSCLYHVLNTRLNLRKPTIISTNLSAAELRKTYSDRITSRLMGEYQVLQFRGEDVRRQKLR